jgi:hypothetical protein
VLQTGTFVPVHALGEEQHAYRWLILSLPIPLAYLKTTQHAHALHFDVKPASWIEERKMADAP